LKIDGSIREKGFGSKLIKKINKFLDEKGKSGLLFNAISSTDIAYFNI